jgi:hypothetical protein
MCSPRSDRCQRLRRQWFWHLESSDSHGGKVFSGMLLEFLTQAGSKGKMIGRVLIGMSQKAGVYSWKSWRASANFTKGSS